MITKKRNNLIAMFYVFVRTFVLIFVGWWKKFVLSIFETILGKCFVKDQKYFRGTCCFSISENLLTIHITYAENGLMKTLIFYGTPLTLGFQNYVKLSQKILITIIIIEITDCRVQKALKFGCDVLRFRQNFCSDFCRMMEKCVLPIFGTFLKKCFVKDQNIFEGLVVF